MMRRARTYETALAVALLALALGGCAAIGFDPLDTDNPALEGGAGGSSGGTGGTVTSGGQGGSGSGGTSGSGGSGGSAGVGATGGTSGDGGSGGTMIVPNDGGTLSDGGPPNPCEDKPFGAPCDDGNFCTVEFCAGGFCLVDDLDCSNECNSGVCIEELDVCELTPLPNDTECGRDDELTCEDGECPEPAMQCTDECNPMCDGDCSYDCTQVNSCRPTCSNGADCEVDCTGTAECKVDCIDSICSMGCERSGTCEMRCSGDSAACTVTCTDPSGCEASACLDGASCRLICLEEAESCGFAECWANDQRLCDDGITITCNAECPVSP